MAVTVSACLSVCLSANITPQLHARSSSDYLMHVSLAQSSTSAIRPVHRVGQKPDCFRESVDNFATVRRCIF